MARPDPAVALVVPSEARRGGPERREPDDDRPRLRLVVTRGQLEIELAERFRFAPITVHELGLSLSDVRFPVELSSGVAGFRHKRGRLERLALSLAVGDAQRFAQVRWSKLLDGELVHHMTAPLEDGWLVGLATERSALTFEVVLAPHDGDVRLVPTAARGLGLSAPPQALAIRALHALFKPHAVVSGGALVVERAPALLARAVLPLAGVRAPDATGIAWTEAVFDVGEVRLYAERERSPWTPGAQALRALELAALVADAEHALVEGDLETARRGYLDALGRAPRHRELARRLAEVDRVVGERAEAALVTLSDAMPPVEAGPLGAALLLTVGDRAGAQNAFVRVAEQEPYGGLAARCWLEAAGCSDDPATIDQLLDEAVARAPTLATARWRRFERKVRAGRMLEARGEAEHLEAGARTPSERHDVARRAAAFLATERAHAEAARMYERALRYAPDSADAVAGLSRALGALGNGRRALELMGRAVALADRKRQPAHALRIAFAQLVAEQADDRPLAIAQVTAVPPHLPETFEARLLEARWRAELGDLAGASDALARLLDAVEAAMGALVSASASRPAWEGPPREEARVAIGQLLLEGARIHEIDRRDAPAARRMLGLALTLAPRHVTIQRAFARVAPHAGAPVAEVAPPTPPTPKLAPSDEMPTRKAPPQEAPLDTKQEPRRPPSTEHSPHSITLDVDVGVLRQALEEATADDELRVEELTGELRARPADAGIALALAEILERLGRDHELLALLSARIDEASGEARAALVGERRKVLDRLVTRAREAGRDDEAQLYETLREADS
jgi:tetratricopeptide (TPR) repeat protein